MELTEESAFVFLMEQHSGIIRKTLSVYCCQEQWEDDLRQEIWIEAWKSWKKFRGECKFSTWLYKIARNTIVTFFRKAANSLQATYIEYRPNIHDIPWQEYIEYDPSSILDNLSDRERECFLLYAEGMSYVDMAEKLGEPENRLRVRICRIRERLGKKFRSSLI